MCIARHLHHSNYGAEKEGKEIKGEREMPWYPSWTLSSKTRLDNVMYLQEHPYLQLQLAGKADGYLRTSTRHLIKGRHIRIGRLANFFWAKRVPSEVTSKAPRKDIMTEPSTQPTLTPQFCFSTVALKGRRSFFKRSLKYNNS
jgi:hypothetical protein